MSVAESWRLVCGRSGRRRCEHGARPGRSARSRGGRSRRRRCGSIGGRGRRSRSGRFQDATGRRPRGCARRGRRCRSPSDRRARRAARRRAHVQRGGGCARRRPARSGRKLPASVCGPGRGLPTRSGSRAELIARRSGATRRPAACYLQATQADLSLGAAKLSGSAQVWEGDSVLQHGSFVMSRETWRGRPGSFGLDPCGAEARLRDAYGDPGDRTRSGRPRAGVRRGGRACAGFERATWV